MAKPAQKPLSLALQGGGAHGAYTWGVLDRLAEENRFDIQAITATSAGAMNAVAFASGYGSGGVDGARKALEALWQAVSHSGGLARAYGALNPAAFAYASALQNWVSPYDLNPLNVNPLRDAVDGVIDFEAVHASGLQLFLSATDVQTGHVKVFSGDEVTLDAVLASACLPQTFQAVEINGHAYWDGGYMGNPSLFPLIYGDAPNDVLLVTLNPIGRPGVPKRAGEIQERVNEISFNAALIGELRAIAFVQRLLDEGMLKEPMLKKYRRLNVHAIRGGVDLVNEGLRTKFDTSWSFLTGLRDKGREAAGKWLAGDASHVGTKESNVDLRKEFLQS
ncbi:MAG: patatin-like phospholipase family protein [Hyphomonas sp.]